MLYLRNFAADLELEAEEKWPEFVEEVGDQFRPLLSSSLKHQAEVLGLAGEEIRSRRVPPSRRFPIPGQRRHVSNGEVFSDGENLFMVSLSYTPRELWAYQQWEQNPERMNRKPEPTLHLHIAFVGSDRTHENIEEFLAVVGSVFDEGVREFSLTSERFDEIMKETEATTPDIPSNDELEAARVLADKTIRRLAVAIKKAGGLLVPDLEKQLPEDSDRKADDLAARLLDAEIIDKEIVVICRRTDEQVNRLPSRDVLRSLRREGVKCACGQSLADEQISEAVNVSEKGRGLLDGSRWMTILLIHELREIGINADRILVEQEMNGSEMDCFAEISGELLFLELKDKEFNLGSAYSFGAKMGIFQADHPIVVTTEYVGNDAKEHFKRTAEAEDTERPFRHARDADDSSRVNYIEGIDSLGPSLRELAHEIYAEDAANTLETLLPFGLVDARDALESLGSKDASSPVEAAS